jgi:hypothetical protein
VLVPAQSNNLNWVQKDTFISSFYTDIPDGNLSAKKLLRYNAPGGGPLRTGQWNVTFHKRQGVLFVASEEGLNSIELWVKTIAWCDARLVAAVQFGPTRLRHTAVELLRLIADTRDTRHKDVTTVVGTHLRHWGPAATWASVVCFDVVNRREQLSRSVLRKLSAPIASSPRLKDFSLSNRSQKETKSNDGRCAPLSSPESRHLQA